MSTLPKLKIPLQKSLYLLKTLSPALSKTVWSCFYLSSNMTSYDSYDEGSGSSSAVVCITERNRRKPTEKQLQRRIENTIQQQAKWHLFAKFAPKTSNPSTDSRSSEHSLKMLQFIARHNRSEDDLKCLKTNT